MRVRFLWAAAWAVASAGAMAEPSAALAKWLHKTVGFDVLADLAPIALIATTPLVLFARPELPANDALLRRTS